MASKGPLHCTEMPLPPCGVLRCAASTPPGSPWLQYHAEWQAEQRRSLPGATLLQVAHAAPVHVICGGSTLIAAIPMHRQ